MQRGRVRWAVVTCLRDIVNDSLRVASPEGRVPEVEHSKLHDRG